MWWGRVRGRVGLGRSWFWGLIRGAMRRFIIFVCIRFLLNKFWIIWFDVAMLSSIWAYLSQIRIRLCIQCFGLPILFGLYGRELLPWSIGDLSTDIWKYVAHFLLLFKPISPYFLSLDPFILLYGCCYAFFRSIRLILGRDTTGLSVVFYLFFGGFPLSFLLSLPLDLPVIPSDFFNLVYPMFQTINGL